jgi:pimeloyl-ACP methyl ester carboxylesterase
MLIMSISGESRGEDLDLVARPCLLPMDERAFLNQLESANTEELSQILQRASPDEQRLLEVYFGAARLERLRRLALKGARRGKTRGNVVVLHGITGGELTVSPPNEASQHVWLNLPRIAIGALGWLGITPELKSKFDVQATGIFKKWYSEMLLNLAADQWNVQAFWYDWRLDFANIADALRGQIDRWFGPNSPVNLVAHSMGGLISRTFILRHPDRWARGGHLVMLGTPNHGSFAIPQLITGALDTIRKLAILDVTHSRRELLDVLNTFPSSFQMLPSPLVMSEMEKLYEETTWSGFGVTQKLLDLSRQSHERLASVIDPSRMTYIAGCNRPTKCDVADWNRLDEPAGYAVSLEGDGTVPHRLSFLGHGSKQVPTYFVDCEHGALPNNSDVVGATLQLLAGAPCSLPDKPPKPRGLASAKAQEDAHSARELLDEERLRRLSNRLRVSERGRREVPLTNEEVRAEEMIVHSFLATDDTAEDRGAIDVRVTGAPGEVQPEPKRVRIRIRLAQAEIERISAGQPKVDAISVGHYIGVAPQNAELALDRAISGSKPGTGIDSNLFITALHRRGAVSGELGKNTQLVDTRDSSRVIVLAGMGQPGTFRVAELTVLARELVWMLGRSGRKHLQTVLIGSGAGNIPVSDAICAWLRGVKRALYDAAPTGDPTLEVITFVDSSPTNFLLMHRALMGARETFARDPEALEINYSKPNKRILAAAEKNARAEAREKGVRDLQRSLARDASDSVVEPVRLTIRLQGDRFEFAALTKDASVPQRVTQIKPELIDEVNNQLTVASDFAVQLDRGNLIGRLLIPRDLRETIFRSGVPLVITVDATTARIHFEMISFTPATQAKCFERESFLGTACRLTRQLRTGFAPLPEPPIITGRALRVLVIADPAADAPLPGAREEGESVAAIFEEFGQPPDVEVVRLFGPEEATRVAVLDQLINHRFDILHYCGHCYFNAADPPQSGWLFKGNPQYVLTAFELDRIDRIPQFVFSNACESGITPDRALEQNALLAPSFAEAFFARGVSNFVCTAWPVDDAAALAFARRFYRGLLGQEGPPESAQEAMAAAREEIATKHGRGGLQTWGAYQHYGDPNFRMVAPAKPQPPGKARRRS